MKTNNLRPNGTNTPWQPNPRTVNPSTPLPPDLTPDPLNRKIQDGQKLVGGSADTSVLHAPEYQGPNAYVPLESYSSTAFNQGASTTITNIGANIAQQSQICAVEGLPVPLCYRKIYIYLQALPTGSSVSSPSANFAARLKVQLWRGNTIVAEMPLGTAGGTGPSESIFSCFLYGGNPFADTIGIWTPTGDSQNVHAHYIYSECDRLTVSMVQNTNIESIYVAVGVVSSKHKA